MTMFCVNSCVKSPRFYVVGWYPLGLLPFFFDFCLFFCFSHVCFSVYVDAFCFLFFASCVPSPK